MTRTVPIDFVRAAVATAARQGLDVDALLRPVGISRELATLDRARITAEQATKLTRRLWRITNDELFGLGRKPVPRGSLRLVSFGLIHYPDLGSAITRLAEYQPLLPGLPPMSIHAARTPSASPWTRPASTTRKTCLRTCCSPRCTASPAGPSAGESTCDRSNSLTRHHETSPTTTRFSVPPLRFGSDTAALVFDSDVLRAPIVRSEEDLIAYDRNAPADLLARRDYGTSLTDQVRKILERGLKGQWPTADEVAERLSMSPQTVRRKLGEESTSITQIKEDILRDAAIAALVRGEETVEALSERLGFSEPSAFRRAFRRWTGGPPGSYRHGDRTDEPAHRLGVHGTDPRRP